MVGLFGFLLRGRDQKPIAILCACNPVRCFTAAAPRRTGLRITILRRNRCTGARCNRTTSTEKLFGRDAGIGNLFTDGGNEGAQLGEPCLFRLLCQRFCLRFEFEICSYEGVETFSMGERETSLRILVLLQRVCFNSSSIVLSG